MDTQGRIGHRLVGLLASVERASALDGVGETVRGLARSLTAREELAGLLRGRWLGHSLHPLLTDLAEGAWMGATVLDLIGPSGSEKAARHTTPHRGRRQASR